MVFSNLDLNDDNFVHNSYHYIMKYCFSISVMPNIIGQAIDEIFQLQRPLVEFTIQNVGISIPCYF